MYRYLDRPVSELEPRDRLLLWSMRHWVRSTTTGRCPCVVLGPAFQDLEIADALPHFAMVMFTLNADARTRLRFATPCSPRVGDDEACLLSLFDAGTKSAPGLLRRLADQLVCFQAAGNLAAAVSLTAATLVAAPLFQVADRTAED
jgi:hypothetical protein